ncbi:fimbrial protein [Leclercia sp.]|uniref:fimbrial protein n=1 Tax=Leclercia sp. TaxID=1898428 RepID=UPI0028ABDD2B|nr:fimbrial protein [Leclercia sp.]
MNKRKTLLVKLCAVLLLLGVALPSWATCNKKSTSLQADSGYSAIIPFGKINLPDPYFVPVGSLLASTVVPSTNYTTLGATGSTVFWECDQADLPNIYYLIATNGDDRVGGNVDIGARDGLDGVYATWFAYVGLRQTMSGVVVSRYWKKVPITTYGTEGGKIQIRLQDIPPLQAELYRVSTLPPAGVASFCAGIAYASSAGNMYTCTEPNTYIQLSGDDNVSFSFGHDKPGDDCATKYAFWGSDNGFGYGMRTANKLYSNPTCVARNVTPFVLFPTITANALEEGQEVTGNFSVRVECSDAMTSGINDRQTALGLQVSDGAYSAASTLGLVNGSGGVSALVSDNYFDSSMAKGVGITVANSKEPAKALTFVGQPGIATLTPGGNAAGWYPVLQGATKDGSSMAGYSWYTYDFIATLKKLNGQTVTPGKVHATAYVLVKMQ